MEQFPRTTAADTNTLPTHRFKIQSTDPTNNNHIENQIPITSKTSKLATDTQNRKSNDIRGNKSNIINAAATMSTQPNNKTTLHELTDNNNMHDNFFNVKIPPTTKDDTPQTTSITTTTSLLWFFLVMTTITRTAATAIQWPVIKRGSTVCLVEETFNESPGGQQLTDEHLARTWDVWLLGKLNSLPATKELDKCWKEEEGRAKHAEDNLRRVTQRTAATVQWMVFESDSGDFDAEAPVGSANYEVRSEGIQCRYWEAWLNKSTTQFCRAISHPVTHRVCHLLIHPLTDLVIHTSIPPWSNQSIHTESQTIIDASVAELQLSLLNAHQTNSPTMTILSLLTPVTMTRLPFVTIRSVQQAVVLFHGAAESYHEGFNVTSWDVWIRMVELPGVERGHPHE